MVTLPHTEVLQGNFPLATGEGTTTVSVGIHGVAIALPDNGWVWPRR